VAGSCDHVHEPSESIKGKKFDQLSDYRILKNFSVPPS